MHRALVVSHRWVSLVLGLVLVAITTSGAFLLYEPEWQRWTHPEIYTATSSARPMTLQGAIELVARTHPDFRPASANVFSGVVEVGSAEKSHPGVWVVDPGRGEITGYVDADRGLMGLMTNLHECALSCAGHPGHLPGLAASIPGVTGALPGTTWGTAVLALSGVLLGFLALTGLVLWWPGLKRWVQGFRVRWRHSRYTRDFDLHQVIGLVAAPFLLMWAITGSSFELPLDKAWYALTGGQAPAADRYAFTSKAAAPGTPDIGVDAAVAAATRTVAGRPVAVHAPTETGRAGRYRVYLSAGVGPHAFDHDSSQALVYVDRYDAGHVKPATQAHYASVSAQAWENWRAGTLHSGSAVNGGWRLVWFGFGLVPLILAATGVSTWLYKRGVARRRRLARRTGSTELPAAAGPDRAGPVPRAA